MQKRIIKIFIGYILVMCLVGGGLFVKRQFDCIPVVDDAIIQELLDSAKIAETNPEEITELPDEDSGVKNNETEDSGNNYWSNYYRETETGEGKKNPVVTQIQEKITSGDKLKIMMIIKKNLTSDEIKYMLSLSKNGFSSSEQTEIKAILKERIGEEEKNELKSLLLKYL